MPRNQIFKYNLNINRFVGHILYIIYSYNLIFGMILWSHLQIQFQYIVSIDIGPLQHCVKKQGQNEVG